MAASAGTDSLFGRIGEYFTLSAARAAQSKLGEPARKAMDRALSLGRQRADAAESLWSNGHTAEGLRLAVRSLEDTLLAGPPYVEAMGVLPSAPAEKEASGPEKPADKPASGPSVADGSAEGKSDPEALAPKSDPEASAPESDPEASAPKSDPEAAVAAAAPAKTAVAEGWSSALLARGATSASIDKIRAAMTAASKAELPTLDADVSAAHADLFQQVLDARQLVDRSLASVALSPRDLGWTRFSRIATTSLVAVLGVVGLYFGLRTPEGVFADASDVWAQSPQFAAENVLDGNDDSYWLLPDGATGWVEARISPSVSISRIRLLNTHNPPHNDRATSDYAIEIYSGGEVAQTVEGRFEFSTHPEFVSHDVSVSNVERIRFVVRGNHMVGAGLAELQWD